MTLSRRDFLKVSGAAITTAWAPGILGAWDFTPNFHSFETVPILQTFTNESTAQFRVLVSSQKQFIYEIQYQNQMLQSLEHLDRFIHPAWKEWAVDHLIVRNLKLHQDYVLIVRDAGSGKIVDQRVFSALNRFQRTGRTAMISCLCDDFPEAQAHMWKVVASQNPDVVFLLGDAVYLDGRESDDEAGMWRRHLEVRRSLDLFRWPRLRPVISVWDDHDYGINDGSRDFPFKKATRKMFDVMFGSIPQKGLELGPSLALEASLFGQRFFLMDDRYYRTKNVALGTHWGDEQESWMLSQLRQTAQPSFLLNGSQFFGEYSGYESFERQHPQNFESLLQKLSRESAPVVFASGDRHFSELMQIESKFLGYQTLELTSSSLHSYKPEKLPEAFNPRRLSAAIDYNFLLLESTAYGSGLDLRVRSIGPNSSTLFEHSQKIRRDL